MSLQKRAHGQALAEYALAIVLVAVTVIVAAALLGIVTQRVYGLVTGALGGNGHGATTSHTITISSAQCIAVASTHQTGLWVTGNTDENLANVTGVTETGPSSVSPNGSGFVFNPLVDGSNANLNECPASVVIQAQDGTVAVAPLSRVNQ